MKFTAFLLVLCIVLLSSFGQLTSHAQSKEMDCCKKAKTACHHSPAKNKNTDSGCNEPGCTAMFSCAFCAGIVKERLTLLPVIARLLPKPVPHLIILSIRGYQSESWKPPQTC